jgi:NAD(P)-dependent dehydrogenase (short-subunit alcohol dehydrogenase family)
MTVVLITGALTGIGRATALAFAREGDQIVVSRRHGEAGEELAPSSARTALRRSSSAPTCDMTMRCGI